MITFEGKTAIVTGAGRGIGERIARLLVSLGAQVSLVDVDEAGVTATAKALGGPKRGVHAFAGDVASRGFVESVVADVIERWSQVDVLVNNAGITRDNLVDNITETDWDAVMDVNLKGPFLCCQAVAPHMRERGYGKIVNIASRSALGNIGQSNYSASKGGVISLTRTLALELAKHGINVNAVSPGLVETPMTDAIPERVMQKLLRMQPGGKAGKPQDIANAVCFLASDAAGYINGQVLYVDGGRSCGILPL